MSGTMRALVAGMVQGVSKGLRTEGWTLVGVGYRAQAQGDKLNLSLGFSHPIVYQLAGRGEGGNAVADRDPQSRRRQAEGRPVAAEVRGYKPPEPYRARGCATRRSRGAERDQEEVRAE